MKMKLRDALHQAACILFSQVPKIYLLGKTFLWSACILATEYIHIFTKSHPIFSEQPFLSFQKKFRPQNIFQLKARPYVIYVSCHLEYSSSTMVYTSVWNWHFKSFKRSFNMKNRTRNFYQTFKYFNIISLLRFSCNPGK